MKKLILVGTLILLAFSYAPAQRINTDRQQPKKAPEGTTITGNRVTLKRGYKFVREEGGRTVAVVRLKSGGLVARFQCNCKAATNTNQPGSCEPAIVEGSMTQCVSSANCNECLLEVVVVVPRPTTVKSRN